MSNSPFLDCTDPGDRSSKLLQNNGNYLLTDTASNPRRLESSLPEPQILHS